MICLIIAVALYWPFARAALLGNLVGFDVKAWPLSFYMSSSFYTMKTDAFDRFGTSLEKRFSRSEIAAMMASAGLLDVRFSDSMPFWVAVGFRAKSAR